MPALNAALPGAIEAMREAFTALSSGGATVPLRLGLETDRGVTLLMPAHLHAADQAGAKVVSVYPANAGRGLPVIHGVVLVIDTATGRHFDTIVGGNQPTGLDVSPDGQFLAHSDFLDNRVTIYEIPSYEVYLDGNGGRYDAHFSEIRKRRSGR